MFQKQLQKKTIAIIADELRKIANLAQPLCAVVVSLTGKYLNIKKLNVEEKLTEGNAWLFSTALNIQSWMHTSKPLRLQYFIDVNC